VSFDSCKPCPEGYASPAVGAQSNASCVACPIGQTAAKGSSSCSPKPCAAGHYQSGIRCAVCPVGTFKSKQGDGQCTSCPVNTYNNLTSSIHETECLSCPVGKFSRNASSRAIDCLDCPAGTTEVSSSKGVDTAGCVACAVRTFKETRGSGACKPCPDGLRCNLAGQLPLPPELGKTPPYSIFAIDRDTATTKVTTTGTLCSLVLHFNPSHHILDVVAHSCLGFTHNTLQVVLT